MLGDILSFKKAFDHIFEKRRKKRKNKFANITSLLRKSKEKKLYVLIPLEIQIWAILFQVDCSTNQYLIFLLFRI